MGRIRLGLIGDKIQASRAPELHRVAGRLCGIDVQYDRLLPRELGLDVAAVLERCERDGMRGVNITYPYKEAVLPLAGPLVPPLRALGALNTIVFDAGERRGANTDCSGFAAGFRHRFAQGRPGIVAIAGAGGAGRAIAFALTQLGATELRLVDADPAKARSLAAALALLDGAPRVIVSADAVSAADGADGIVNATPLGMGGIGNAIPDGALPGRRWAFDAVYTPERTPFVAAADRVGLQVMSGFELFLFQGVDAFALFTGHTVDPDALRRELRASDGV